MALGDQIEFIRAAATKAGLARQEINKLASVLWDTLRRAGALSVQFPKGYGNPKLHDVSLATAKDLGYRSAQQRQRWEICAAVPNIEVEHLKDKILASSEMVLTLSALPAICR